MTLSVLIAVTHLLGAGHLVRASAIGRALARRGHRVTLVSGGEPVPLADLGGLDVVQLPSVRCPVGDFSTLLGADGRQVSATHLEERRRQLVSALTRTRPDVVITEQFPFGRRVLAGEFQSLLDAVEVMRPAPLLLASVRDILVAPTKPERVARTHTLVARRYAAVLVHGDEATVPLDRSWPVDAGLRAKLIYTGYVGPQELSSGPWRRPQDGSVLVSGGSSAAGVPLYRAALAAARAQPGRTWRVLVGSAVDAGALLELQAQAPRHAIVERVRSDFRDLLGRAAVFVGQAGYNTVMDIIATRARSVLVPFEQGRETEQRLRAEGFAARGLATLLPEDALTPATLLEAVAAAEARPRPLFEIALDGQDRAARAIEMMASDAAPARGEASQ